MFALRISACQIADGSDHAHQLLTVFTINKLDDRMKNDDNYSCLTFSRNREYLHTWMQIVSHTYFVDMSIGKKKRYICENNP
jgi:hypothetical protein